MKYENKVWIFLHFLLFENIIDYVLYVVKIWMKKIFLHVWQRISKHKKKMLYGVLAFFVGQICFFGLWWIWVENQVFAQNNWGETATQSSELQKSVWSRYKTMELFRKVVYVVIYPVLMLAWKLVDNSLVYWESFNFDAVLWNLWVTVRNLANFALWFIFIFKIFSYLIKQDKNRDVKKILVRSLIAWVWIQASWFIMMVLIDLSTVLTYSVWWLPLSVLPSTENDESNFKYNPYILSTVSDANVKEMENINMYLSNEYTSGSSYISECELFHWSNINKDQGGEDKMFILAPKMLYYKDDKWKYFPTEQNRCHIWDQVYKFVKLYDWIKWATCTSYQDCIDNQNAYNASLTEVKGKLRDQPNLEWGESLLEEWKFNTKDGKLSFWFDQYNKSIWEDRNLKRLKDVLWSGNYAGTFTVLYTSLINAWDGLTLWVTKDNSIYVSLLNSILSFAHMVAIWIPLIAMCIVFVMRIWVLWMAIALSPLIVLCMAFDIFESKFMKDLKILDHLKFSNLIGIIFSPVVICFAVSMSTVLVRIISSMNMNDSVTSPTDILWWTISLNIQWMWVNMWKFICSVICVAITWFLVWAAVKSTELWKKLESLEKLATSAIWSVPIIPIPGKDGKTEYIGVSSAIGLNGQQWIIWNIWSKIASKYNAKDYQALSERLDPDGAKEKAEKKQQEVAETKIVDSYFAGLSVGSISWKWTDTPFGEWWKSFNQLELSAQKKVIEKINGMGEGTRQKLWDGENKINVWSDTYIFDKAGKKYVINNSPSS